MKKKINLQKILILHFFFLGLVSCFSSHQNEESIVTTIQVRDLSEDIQIPKEILNNVEKEAVEESKTHSLLYTFLPLTVEFNEKTEGVLKNNPIRFQFQKGGGAVDLKDVTVGQGTFYMSFPAEQFANQPELVHLYYVSQSPQKNIAEEKFGLGCGRWLDLKSKFKNLQSKDFLKLNTTDLRHLYVLAGHYIFVFRQNSQIFLTQLTVIDSRHKDRLCPELAARTK